MSRNLEIVELFLSDFYRNRRAELAEIISPKFRYQSPFFGNGDFEKYLIWLKQMSNQRSITKKSELKTDDDQMFVYDFILKVLDFSDGFQEEMVGCTVITIKDGLIEYVENTYSEATSNPEKFARVKAKLLN